jgi:predicted nucleic acid-binding protein
LRFLLDTNVISEVGKGGACNPSVAGWYDATDSLDLALSVLVLGEVMQGIEKLRRHGAHCRAQTYTTWLDELKQNYTERLLPVTPPIAERWGQMRAARPLPPIDGLMAATAVEHDLTFVTRDTGPLGDTGVRLLNPWL